MGNANQYSISSLFQILIKGASFYPQDLGTQKDKRCHPEKDKGSELLWSFSVFLFLLLLYFFFPIQETTVMSFQNPKIVLHISLLWTCNIFWVLSTLFLGLVPVLVHTCSYMVYCCTNKDLVAESQDKFLKSRCKMSSPDIYIYMYDRQFCRKQNLLNVTVVLKISMPCHICHFSINLLNSDRMMKYYY